MGGLIEPSWLARIDLASSVRSNRTGSTGLGKFVAAEAVPLGDPRIGIDEELLAMNLDLQDQLRESGVSFLRLTKSEKVKLLVRWTKEFPDLVLSARHGQRSPNVARDTAADGQYAKLRGEEFWVLPDDQSGMPSCFCQSDAMPDLHTLVSDTITRCDELVILASDFRWSVVLVNHGSPQLVGRYFQDRTEMPFPNLSVP